MTYDTSRNAGRQVNPEFMSPGQQSTTRTSQPTKGNYDAALALLYNFYKPEPSAYATSGAAPKQPDMP
jgi:hypothetical protein